MEERRHSDGNADGDVVAPSFHLFSKDAKDIREIRSFAPFVISFSVGIHKHQLPGLKDVFLRNRITCRSGSS